MFKIDKSLFDADELVQYERLIAKAKVDPETNGEELEEEKPPVPPKKKPEEEGVEKSIVPDFVKDAIAKSEEFMARIEKQEMEGVAKKYAVLGENPAVLGEKLYNLKKSDSTMYDTCISMLDNQLSLIEKSGVFTEIGKSAGGYTAAGGAEAKAEAKAKEIMKSNPDMNYVDAIAKAWEDPALMAEYDAEYNG